MTNPRDVLSRIEPRYLCDYLSFAGQVREYINDTLDAAFQRDPNPIRRPYHMVSLVLLEYAAYEDAAALIKAFLDRRAGQTSLLTEGLRGYRPGEAVLDDVLAKYGVTTGDDLFNELGLAEQLPANWSTWFPGLDIAKTLRLACAFLAMDCRKNQKKYGVAAYNKLKHGPIVVENASEFSPGMPAIPAMLIPNRDQATVSETPFVIYGFEMQDTQIDERQRLVHFVQRSLRLLVACYVGIQHLNEVQHKWGGLEGMWRSSHLRDIVELVDEVTRKK